MKLHFSPARNVSCNLSVLGENVLKETSRKRSLYNKRKRRSGQEVEIVNLDGLVVGYPPKKRSSRERFTSPSKTRIRSAKTSSDGRHLKQSREIRAATPPATASVVKKMWDETKKTLEDSSQSPEAEFRSIVRSCFDDHLNGILPDGYTEPSMCTVDVSHS